LKKYNERYRQQARLTESALRVLEDYSWPGNVRQLQHMIDADIVTPQGRIDDTGDSAKPSNSPSLGYRRAIPWPIRSRPESGVCSPLPAGTRAGPLNPRDRA